jgi:hypothetical protein
MLPIETGVNMPRRKGDRHDAHSSTEALIVTGPEHGAVTRCRCRQGLGNRGSICARCRDRVHHDLTELPQLYQACEQLLINTPLQQLERVNGRGGSTIPLNASVATLRSEIMGTLASWSGLVVSEQRISRPPNRTAADLSAFLVRHLDWLAGHPAAGDFADEVCAMVSTARMRAVVTTSTRIELGSCTQPGCDEVIRASFQYWEGRAVHQVGCGSGHRWETHQWLLLAQQLRGSEDTGAPLSTRLPS